MKTKHLSLLIAMLLVPLYIFADRSDVITANTLGGSVSFSRDGDYEWIWDGVNKRLQSTNYGISNSTSQTTISFTTSKPGLVSFDYAVSSEQNCDVLTVQLDGTIIVNGASGTVNSSVMCPVISTGSHTLIVKYTKDSSKNTNNDCAYISNLQFNDKITGTCGNTAYYEYNADTQTLKITGEGAMNNYSSTNMPWNIVKQQIKNIEIGESITSIGDYAFYGCTEISNIIIPSNITKIGNNAFSNNSNLLYVYNKSALSISTGSSSNGYVGYYAKVVYKIDGNDTIEDVGDYRFVIDDTSVFLSQYFGNSQTAELPETYNGQKYNIGSYAFYSKSSISTIVMPKTIKEIRPYAFSGCSNIADLVLPDSLRTIGESAFYGCKRLDYLIIPTDVTSIGSSAFWECNNMKIIYDKSDLPLSKGNSSNGYIAYYANYIWYVSKDAKLEKQNDFYFLTDGSDIILSQYIGKDIELTLPTDYKGYSYQIGNYLLYKNTNLKKITLPNNISAIRNYAFYGCTGLSGVNIPSSVTSIGDYAFYGCNGMSDIAIPENVSNIGQSAFGNCINISKLTYNAINATVSTNSSYLSFPTSIANVIIGSKVKTIPSYFLYNCSKIQTISLPQSLSVIGSQAFYNCSGINDVKIPENVTSIGQSAFGGTSLNSITFNAKNAAVYTNTSYPSFPTTISNITFGEDVETIPDYLCYNWTELKSVVLPTKLTSIGSYAFRNCSGITAIDIPNTVASIGDYAFNSCGLKYLNLGSGLLTIGQYAFYNCSSLSSVTIPNTVTSIKTYAFYNCNLKSLTVGAGVTTIGNNAFAGNTIKTIWLCNTAPSGYSSAVGTINYAANNAFSSSGSWKIYKYISSAFVVDGIKYVPVSPSDRTCDAIDCVYDETSENTKISETVSYKKIAMSVLNVNPYTCYGNTYIKNAEVTSSGILGNYVFYGCRNMESGTIGDKITSIGSYAFSGCSALQGIIIPESVTSLGTHCFQNCSSIPEITIPEATKSIGDYAFHGCSSIADVKIADRTTSLSLGSNGSSPLFSSCPLKTVYIGGKISYNTGSNYGYSPFYRKTTLESVVITDTEEQIYNNEFYGCTGLKSVKIGDGVKSIGNWAFSGCSSLEEFSFGNSMQTIGQEAFSDCVNITKITALTAVPPICGSQALDDINKWECELSVPVESVDDYYDAPQWKEFFFIEGVETYTMALSDTNTEIKEGTFDTGTVAYSRTGSSISDGKYGSFCLPFKIDLNETTCFKKVYVPAGFVLYNTNSGNICIMFDSYPMNSSIPAGTPFVAILNGNPVNLVNSQVEKYTSAEPATITTTMNVYNYSGDGALWQKEDMHVIYGGTYDRKLVTDSGMYSFSSTGNFGDKAIDSTLSPFRNYIQVVTDGGEVKINNVEVQFDDEEDATVIRELLFNNVNTDFVDVYNVNGIKVKNRVDASSALEGLSKGVYIVNGKKVIVK